MKSKYTTIPFLLAASMALGVWLGSGLVNPFQKKQSNEGWVKIEQILQYVQNDYVDTVSKGRLEDEIISFLLQRLDPHSYYISEDELASMNEPLEGSFEGIGVQFNLRRDTIYIINVIPSGPSEKSGLRGGDRIISVDGQVIAGTGQSNRQVMALLKGPKGSSVSVGVKRKNETDLIDFDIERGTIPLASIDAAYLLDEKTIYTRLSKFSKTTHEEFQKRVYPLKNDKVESFILDLRGNGGGLLDEAVWIADEFLVDNMLITYTEGKSRPRTEFTATNQGAFEDLNLIDLIDGYSASASEIVAGALQDHNRATIVGTRSFGKGLVQEQSEWKDGSATRLTVARYFTPLGRSIQKQYESVSSNSFDTTFSEGGIDPDVQVDRDTSGITWLYAELVHRAWLGDFAYRFRDQHVEEITVHGGENFVMNFDTIVFEQELRAYLIGKDYEINEKEWSRSIGHMIGRAQGIIARSIYGEEVYFKINNVSDEYIRASIEALASKAS